MTVRLRRLSGALLVLTTTLLAGCVGVGAESRPVATTDPSAPKAAVDFRVWEAAWLDRLGATDPRLALRMPAPPSVAAKQRVAGEAVVRGTEGLALLDGALNVFSFEARERALQELADELNRAPSSPSEGDRAERVLLERLVAAEAMRLVRERGWSGSASERVRALVETWGAPKTPGGIEERESEVVAALEPVTADVLRGRLPRGYRLELEEALDALERVAVPEGYPRATRAITALRVELGRAHPSEPPRGAALPVAEALATFVGGSSPASFDVVRLEEEDATLRLEAKAELARVPEPAANEILAAAARHVHAVASYARPAGSLVRAWSPPKERALVFEVLALLDPTTGPLDATLATVTLHDDVAIALWAIALDRGATDLDATRTAHPLLASVSPSDQDRLVRAALVYPTAALAVGFAVTMLDAEGRDERRPRAHAWKTFGDAPFDLVAPVLDAATKERGRKP